MESESESEASQDGVQDPQYLYHLRILNAIRQIIHMTDLDSRRLAAEHQVTTPQLMSLMAVAKTDQPTTAVEIARNIHVSASTLVGVLDRLEAKGLIRRERNAEDRREVSIVATSAGRTLVTKPPFPLQYSLGKALHQLSQNEREQVALWMERLVDLMEPCEIDAGPMLDMASISQHHTEHARPGRST